MASSKQRPFLKAVRYQGEYLALRAVVSVANLVPIEPAVAASGWLWGAIGPRLSRHRRATRHLARMMPELPDTERERVLRQMWRHLGQTFMEALMLDRLASQAERIEMDDVCRTIEQRTRLEGGVIAALHLGNWEAMVIPLALTGPTNHAAVYRRAANPLTDDYMLNLRSKYYSGGLFAKGSDAARRVMRHIRSGGSVGLMADLREQAGEIVPFFGSLAPSTPFPAMLARQYGRPLFAVGLIRLAPARFRMVATEIAVPNTPDRAADIVAATAELQSVFERWIRQWPEQWMWAHRRYDN